MKSLNRNKLFILAFFILIGNLIIGYSAYISKKKHIESEYWVAHTEIVINKSNEILSMCKDIETSFRGYVITNDTSFLKPLYSKIKPSFLQIEQLRQLTRDNSSQQIRIDSLYLYVKKGLDYTLKMIDLRNKKGFSVVAAVVSTKKGLHISNQVRLIAANIQNEENRLLKIRTLAYTKSQATYNYITMVMFILMVVITLILLYAFGNILYHNKEKEKRAAELDIANKEIALQNIEREKKAAELIIAQIKAEENQEKAKLTERLIIANRELEIQIAEKEKQATELFIAKNKAEENDKLKSAFLANMSHEIRTPMNGILGFTELLKNPHLTGEMQQKYIGLIESGGARMLNLINDLINISKLESGQTKLMISAFNILEQCEQIYSFFKPEVDKKGMLMFFNNGLDDQETLIKTDHIKIDAILSNLIKNAIKYSDEGSIEFGYHLRTENEPAELLFYVKDTGLGISNDKKESIFDRFVQSDNSHERAYQGAGLGLAIAKGYVELLGGEIWVESELGQGSTFFFTIPYERAIGENTIVKKNVEITEPEQFIRNIKILIVEDDESSAMLLKNSVENFSSDILVAENGLDAISLCRNNPDIDLIFMDTQMPLMNGNEATREIRLFNKGVVIIAQSAHVYDDDKEIALEAGCNDFITKPIYRGIMRKLVNKYFSQS